MSVRLMRTHEVASVTQMMLELCPEERDYDFSSETVYVWERPEGSLGGFASVSIRPWAEGCISEPVPYIEGWWVAPDLRQKGVGRALFVAIETWCMQNGHVELGSDTEIDNLISMQAHASFGFEPTLRLQFFRKRLA